MLKRVSELQNSLDSGKVAEKLPKTDFSGALASRDEALLKLLIEEGFWSRRQYSLYSSTATYWSFTHQIDPQNSNALVLLHNQVTHLTFRASVVNPPTSRSLRRLSHRSVVLVRNDPVPWCVTERRAERLRS